MSMSLSPADITGDMKSAAGLHVSAVVVGGDDVHVAVAAEIAIGGQFGCEDAGSPAVACTPPNKSDYADEAELISWMATTWQSIHEGYFTREAAVAALFAVAAAEVGGEDESSAYAWATATHEAMISSGKFTVIQACAGLEETVVSMREHLIQQPGGGRYV